MKSGSAAAVLLFGIGARCVAALQLVATSQESPVTQVVKLLTDLKSGIEADGRSEQSSYEKYACYCEDTLSAKAAEISKAKEDIEALQTTIIKLNGEIATHAAEIKQTEKDITANIESQREASEIRDKQAVSYGDGKLEFEQCLGALEAAIKVLSGAGAKKGFLETFQQAQLLSVVAGVRGLLGRPTAKSMKQQDMQVVRRFVESPEEFVGSHGAALSAAQVANNPFGDYAPQSTQIQGILKSMYDSFASDMEKSNVEEAQKQKGHEELMATKQAELQTLKGTLQAHTTDHATKTKDLADSKQTLTDTKEQLAADETFFAQTKETCRMRANEWAQRTRLRTEELAGIAQALNVLSSDAAKKTFDSAATTLLQVRSQARGAGMVQRGIVYDRLSGIAKKSKSLALAKIAVALKSGGHFDEIIAMVDNMIALLRDEEQHDIRQRDWCEEKEGKNKNDMQDLDHSIKKAEAGIERFKREITDLEAKVTELDTAIAATKTAMGDLKTMREQEHDVFVKAVKDDTDAISLLEEAARHLSKFHDNNNKGSFVQAAGQAKPRPEVGWESEGGNYGGRAGEHRGIVAILDMIKEDLQKEVSTARVEDGEAQRAYENGSAALLATKRAQEKSKVQAEKEMAALQDKVADYEEFVGMESADLSKEQQTEQALGTNCAWVASHFETRRDNRKNEIDGLVDAKAYLAGVENDEDI